MPKNEQNPLIVERFFKEFKEKDNAKDTSRPFNDFFNKRIIVLLGDPGSGKTTSFENASKEEPDAVKITPIDLAMDDLDRYKGAKAVYFDAVDEYRVTQGQSTLLASLVGRLEKIGAEKLRIACRTADWHDYLDRQALSHILPDDENECILTFEPLTRENAKLIVADRGLNADAFFMEADRHDTSELLENPHILNLFITVFAQEGDWPETRAELFERACIKMAMEFNKYHKRTKEAEFETGTLLDAAGRIFALHLCADDVDGFSLAQGDTDIAYPWIGDIGGFEKDLLKACVRRTLFHASGQEKVTYTHRTIAEYLAARYLANRIREGTISLDEILSLITGEDSGVLSHTRGLFAWLAALSIDDTDALIRRDPLTVILYGDAARLTISQKEAIIDGLKRISESDDPWFLKFGSNMQFFAPLATKETTPKIRLALEDEKGSSHFKIAILEALVHSKPLPELADTVHAIMRNKTIPEYVRKYAGYAYLKITKDDHDKLRVFLADLKSEAIPDENREIMGHALDELYPDIVTPKELVNFLVDEPKSFVGSYSTFLSHGLFEKTTPSQLQVLVEEFISSPNLKKIIKSPDNHSAPRMLAKALAKVLSEQGTSIPIKTLHRWLTVAEENLHGRHGDELSSVKDFFEANAQTYRELFKLCVAKAGDDYHPLLDWVRLTYLIGSPKEPERFPEFLVDLAAAEQRNNVRDVLLERSIRLCNDEGHPDGVTSNSLLVYAKRFPELENAFKQQLDLILSKRKKYEALDEQHAKKQEAERHKNRESMKKIVTDLTERIETIRDGTDIKALEYLNKTYLGYFNDLDKDEHPVRRLEKTVGHDLSHAYVCGVEAVIQGRLKYSTLEIVKIGVSDRIYPYGNLILTGVDRIAERSEEEFLTLPDDTLRAAVIYIFTNLSGFEQAWIPALTEKQPELVKEALLLYFRTVLKENPDRGHELHSLRAFPIVGGAVAIELLKEFPAGNKKHLEYLFKEALSRGDHQALGSLVAKTLPDKQLNDDYRLLWLAVGFLLDCERCKTDLNGCLCSVDNGAKTLIVFLYDVIGKMDSLSYPFTVAQISFLIGVIGTTHKPEEEESFDTRRPSRRISELIKRLSTDTTQEAVDELLRLRDNPELAAWNDYLAHAAAEQKVEMRHLARTRLTLKQVISVLDGRDPANHAGMLAIVTASLDRVAHDIKHGNTKAYEAFWENLKSKDASRIPRYENYCRDRLLDLLKPKLERRNIVIDREGSYKKDTRSDIKFSYPHINLPFECKRQHYNRKKDDNLWTAIKEQLINKYTADPEAGGYGVYCVFWFGGDYVKKMRLDPITSTRPSSPEELKEMLLSHIHTRYEKKIRIVIIDVSM